MADQSVTESIGPHIGALQEVEIVSKSKAARTRVSKSTRVTDGKVPTARVLAAREWLKNKPWQPDVPAPLMRYLGKQQLRLVELSNTLDSEQSPDALIDAAKGIVREVAIALEAARLRNETAEPFPTVPS